MQEQNQRDIYPAKDKVALIYTLIYTYIEIETQRDRYIELYICRNEYAHILEYTHIVTVPGFWPLLGCFEVYFGHF